MKIIIKIELEMCEIVSRYEIAFRMSCADTSLKIL